MYNLLMLEQEEMPLIPGGGETGDLKMFLAIVVTGLRELRIEMLGLKTLVLCILRCNLISFEVFGL